MDRKHQSFLPVVLLALLSLLVAACGAGSNNQGSTGIVKAPDDQQVLIWPVGGQTELQSYDPAIVTDGPSIDVSNLIFSGMVQLNDKLEVVDNLAQSHQLGPDGLTWTFKLKPNLKFSDGSPLTSKDVAYSLDRALKPELKSGVSPIYLGPILDSDKRFDGTIPTLINHSIFTPDDQTVVLKAASKAAYFLPILTYQTSFVVDKKMIDKYGDDFATHLQEGIGGAGPFKMSKYIRGQRLEFVPNENYFGKKPQLRKIVMIFYQKDDTVYTAYRSGQVHFANNVPSAQLEQAKALPGNQFHLVPQLNTAYYTMNYLVKPFNNIKIRQAFALALDKDALANRVWRGSVVASNHIVPKGMPGYYEQLTGPQGIKTTSGDPALAKKLFEEGLQEEGITRDTFPSITFTFASRGVADARNEVTASVQMWKDVLGVTIKAEDIEWTKLLAERNRTRNNPNGMQMWRLNWGADYPDPENWLTLLFDKGSTKNAYNYGQNNSAVAAQQVAIQQLMEQADVNPNQDERIRQYNQAEQAIVNDVAWIPIYQDALTKVRKPCVVGIVDNAQGFYAPENWANIYITTNSDCANTSAYR